MSQTHFIIFISSGVSNMGITTYTTTTECSVFLIHKHIGTCSQSLMMSLTLFIVYARHGKYVECKEVRGQLLGVGFSLFYVNFRHKNFNYLS